MKIMIKGIKQEKINKILKKENVALAYLFGSQVTGKTGALSDIDIAILFPESISRSEYFEKKLSVLGKLIDLLKIENIDVVVLNEAPPLLAHRIIKEGKILFSKNRKVELEFELRAVMKYLDWRPYLEKYTSEVFG